MYRVAFFAFLFLIPVRLFSQIFPKEGSKLNYILIGFSFPHAKAGTYTLEIAKGHYDSRDSFSRNLVKSMNSSTNKIIAEVPSFGEVYTWHVVSAGKQSKNLELHHFSTLSSPRIDTAIARVRIIDTAKQYKDAYVFIDCMQALYDMNGMPVWFLPDTSRIAGRVTSVLDMKLTTRKTITYIINDQIKEIDYDGKILWTVPNKGTVSGDTSEHYHHEFTRLPNGHYMAMGSEEVALPLSYYKPDTAEETDIIAGPDGGYLQKLKFGTVIEYDENGNVVWSWKCSTYFKKSALYNVKTATGRFKVIDLHENSFFFDDRSQVLYVSCRNLNKILKVKYPEGDLLAEYGFTEQTDSSEMTRSLFSGQHSVKKSQDGYLYLFDNNAQQSGVPKLMVMQETGDQKGDLKMIWEYVCTLDGLTEPEKTYYNALTERRHAKESRHKKVHFTSGGNVVELPDRSIFASMNGPSSKVFIVTQDKEIKWSAVPEQKQAIDTTWGAAPTYRASIIYDHKDLEQLIWNNEGRR